VEERFSDFMNETGGREKKKKEKKGSAIPYSRLRERAWMMMIKEKGREREREKLGGQMNELITCLRKKN
jgi:flagellar biosynthesis regulator FlbT